MGDSRVLGLTIRQHIGGRWAVSWVVYALNVPINFLAIVTSIRSQPVGSQWWGWGLVALMGLLTIALVFVIANFTVLRNRREDPVAVPVVAGVGAVAGVFRAAVVVWTSSALELQPFSADELINRILAGGVIGAVSLPLAALVLSILSTYTVERRRLIDERIAGERERLEQMGRVAALREVLVEGVRNEVSATLASVSVEDPRSVSAAMRATSHRIWNRDQGHRDDRSERPDRVPDVFWPALTSNPVPVLPAVGLWGVTALGTLVGALGPVVGVVNWVSALAVLWVCLTFANRWIERAPDQWGIATTVMLVVAYVFISPVAYVVFDARPLESALPLMIVNAVWLPVCVVLVAIAFTAVASGEEVLRNLAGQVNAAEIENRALEAEREEMLRELAMQLHGTAHSPLIAGSALTAHVDADARERLLEHVGRAVAQMDVIERGGTVAERLAAVALPWDGLVDIAIHVGSGVDRAVTSGSQRRLMDRIVDEAIANAYRHGEATQVHVLITEDAGDLVVEVADNGRGLDARRPPGLGCRLFEATSPGAWSLDQRDGGGSVLLLRFPVVSK